MASPPGYLLDTNILLRLTKRDDPQHHLVQVAVAELDKAGSSLYFCFQNIAEFWNVCTRPLNRNGFGLSTVDAEHQIVMIEQTMTFLADTDKAYALWRRIVIENDVRGVQVHDARLAALMMFHGVGHILTLNDADFRRFSGIHPVHPRQVNPSS